MIKLTNVSKTFMRGTPQETAALAQLNLEIPEGQWVTVVGSNGAGKSTLLKIVAGTEQPDYGNLHIAGVDVTAQREFRRARVVGRLDQEPMASTAPGLSIEQNLAIAMERGRPRGLGLAVTKKRQAIIAEALEPLGMGLENRLGTPVGTLSGGQRQAMALIMATIARPHVLLLDEHIAALDPRAAESVMDITDRLISARNLTALMVTHNMQYALRYGDRLLVMHRGEIILDLSGEKKKAMQLPELLTTFQKASGQEIVSDRTLLG